MIKFSLLLSFCFLIFFKAFAGAPVVSSTTPSEGAKIPVRANEITITYDQFLRNLDDSDLDDNNVDALITVTRNGQVINSGFDVTITSKKVFSISFTGLLSPNANYSITVDPVENGSDEASAVFALDFTTGGLASIDNITASNKVCVGGTANLGTIVIREGFEGNFYGENGQNSHQDLKLTLPNGFSFDSSSGSITVNDGGASNIVVDGTSFGYENFGGVDVLFIGFKHGDVSGSDFLDIIKLSGIKVNVAGNVAPGTYDITLANVDFSYPGLAVNDVVGTITVRANETISLSHNGAGNASSVTICSGDEVVFMPSGGNAPYKFYKEGSVTELATGTSYNTTTLQDGDKIYVVSSGSNTTCPGTSSSVTVTVTSSTPPVITLTDLVTSQTSTVQDGQTFAIPVTAVGMGLSSNQTGVFSGIGVSSNEFLTNNVNKKPGLYQVTFTNQQDCKPDVVFTFEVFDNSRNQILGLQNNGICYDAMNPISIGWLGEGVEGNLVSISSFPNILTGTLNADYNGGLSSGYFIDPNMVRNVLQVGDPVVMNIVYQDNGGINQSVEQTIDVQGIPELEIVLAGELPLEESYCENASSIKIVGNPLGTNDVVKTFSILDLSQSTNISDAVTLTDLTLFFNPSDAPNGTSAQNILTHNNNKGYVLVYEYVSEYGCVAEMTDTIQVVPLPEPLSPNPLQFDFCMGDDMGFIKVAKPDTVDIAWYNSQGFLLAVADSLNPGVNTSFPDVFDFSVRPQNADIGCVGPPTDLSVRVGEFPTADFTSFSNCSVDNKVTFNSSKSLGGSALKDSIQSIYWNFHDPDVFNQVDEDEISHEFPGGGVYEVSLVVETALGCTDSVSQFVSVFEIMDAAINNKVYLETFNLGGGGWISTSENNNANGAAINSSWQLTQVNGSQGWVTANDSTGVFNDNEDSWVESPCFNLDNWDKPKIDMDIRYFTDRFEGTTLQYTISDSAVASQEIQWQTLGQIDGGINWFNSAGIAAAPGGQTIGWEGGTGEWKKSIISLDAVKEKAGGKPVRFRMAFASLELGDGRENNYDGFAFDNFAIWERNRVVVLEHFTNVNAVGNESENHYINDFANARPLDAVKIEYHTSYPASDPIYLLNKSDHSAHALEYGVNDVPRTVMDGIYGVKFRNDPFSVDEWGKAEYAKRTIIDAPFNLVISDTLIATGSSQGRDDGGLKIDVEITKNPTSDTISAPLVLEIGILQKNLEANGNTYHNVLRKLLPDASGTYLYGEWLPNDLSRTETVTEYWTPDFTYNTTDTFLIVAYIHDTHLSKTRTKEIYQGAYKQIKILPPSAAITGLNDNVNGQFKIYPNPSEGDVTIELSEALIQDSPIKVYSSSGSLVYEGNMMKGLSAYKIPLDGYPDGLYIVSFYTEGQMIKRTLILR
ncbi:T9SS type A sorting domain-containing protein [Fulvivirga sp. 29W222]|uniref:T9SS type A sorting domain-containing protein n=1 Tax=Fulvivirga marina TaxID=2494733 RepID=A0A937G155_9BACT|nr:T9SS type A sorting domain-containing protein [Fulvivirga marina]MBL6448178.1 T9SS type A sorting domain-containing protein [Fulvivirga marina]